jgi:hypothetical protein
MNECAVRRGWRVARRRIAAVLFTLSLTLVPRALAQIALQPIASGLSQPVAIVDAGDGRGRLFFVEQTGRIRVWNGASVLPAAFLDVHDLISTGSERGLWVWPSIRPTATTAASSSSTPRPTER